MYEWSSFYEWGPKRRKETQSSLFCSSAIELLQQGAVAEEEELWQPSPLGVKLWSQIESSGEEPCLLENYLEVPWSYARSVSWVGRAVDGPWHESLCGFSVLTGVPNAHILGAVFQYDRTFMKQPFIGPSMIPLSAKIISSLIIILLHQSVFTLDTSSAQNPSTVSHIYCKNI